MQFTDRLFLFCDIRWPVSMFQTNMLPSVLQIETIYLESGEKTIWSIWCLCPLRVITTEGSFNPNSSTEYTVIVADFLDWWLYKVFSIQL